MKTIQEDNGKEVMVMETSWAYTMGDGDGFSNSIGDGATGVDWRYEVSVQGQTNAVRDVMNTVCQAGGLGVFYWEPAWIPVDVWTDGATDVYESNKAAWENTAVVGLQATQLSMILMMQEAVQYLSFTLR